MITFIKNNFFVRQVSEQEYNNNKFFYDTLEQTNVSYNSDLGYLMPLLKGNKFIEGATKDEIEEYEDSKYAYIVSRRQLQLELAYSGYDLDQVDNIINSLSEPNKTIAHITWNTAVTFNRKDELIKVIGNKLEMTDLQIKELFEKASKL